MSNSAQAMRQWLAIAVMVAVLVAAGIGIFWFVKSSSPGYASVGDCLSDTRDSNVHKVSCDDASARYRVNARIPKGQQCPDRPSGGIVSVEITLPVGDEILCLKRMR